MCPPARRTAPPLRSFGQARAAGGDPRRRPDRRRPRTHLHPVHRVGGSTAAVPAHRFGREVLYLHGGTPKVRRDEMVERFQSGAAPIFLLSLRAGGTGLNLTAANHVIHFDRWWNPAVEDQRRIGPTASAKPATSRSGAGVRRHDRGTHRRGHGRKARRSRAGDRSGERWLTEPVRRPISAGCWHSPLTP